MENEWFRFISFYVRAFKHEMQIFLGVLVDENFCKIVRELSWILTGGGITLKASNWEATVDLLQFYCLNLIETSWRDFFEASIKATIKFR